MGWELLWPDFGAGFSWTEKPQLPSVLDYFSVTKLALHTEGKRLTSEVIVHVNKEAAFEERKKVRTMFHGSECSQFHSWTSWSVTLQSSRWYTTLQSS